MTYSMSRKKNGGGTTPPPYGVHYLSSDQHATLFRGWYSRQLVVCTLDVTSLDELVQHVATHLIGVLESVRLDLMRQVLSRAVIESVEISLRVLSFAVVQHLLRREPQLGDLLANFSGKHLVTLQVLEDVIANRVVYLGICKKAKVVTDFTEGCNGTINRVSHSAQIELPRMLLFEAEGSLDPLHAISTDLPQQTKFQITRTRAIVRITSGQSQAQCVPNIRDAGKMIRKIIASVHTRTVTSHKDFAFKVQALVCEALLN